MAPRLEQEFVRVRKGGSDEHRHALLLALVSRTFKKRTLVFCNTKVRQQLTFKTFCVRRQWLTRSGFTHPQVDAHRTKLVLELSGIS
eukprot:18716-Eustigmatos_ZCMA.PRE.1